MIRLVLPADAEAHVSFAMSPLLECVLSLHAFLTPRHHALQHAWVRRMRRLDPELRRRIEFFGLLYRDHIPDLLMPEPGQAIAFETELERLQVFDPEVLQSAFVRPLVDHGGDPKLDDALQQLATRRAQEGGKDLQRAVQMLLEEPSEFTAAFFEMLAEYWATSFQRAWLHIEDLLELSIEESTQILARDGVWSVLGRLPNKCRVDREYGELLIDLPHEHHVVISAERPLVLTPSFFVWPHLRFNCDLPWPLAVVYAAPQVMREAEPRIPDAELLRALQAVADDTRLRALRLIAERPRTAQELEPLLGLSRAGVSKSIQRLAEAGLVRSTRHGYYVVYSLASDRIDAIGTALTSYVRPRGH